MIKDPIRLFLRTIIDNRHLDLRSVSISIGKNHAYLQKFLERGTPKILPSSVAIKIARCLKISPIVLLDGFAAYEALIRDFVATKEEIVLIAIFRRFTANQKKQFHRLLDKFEVRLDPP